MGHNVHLHVCFSCTNNEDVAEVARKYLASSRFNLDPDGRGIRVHEATWFLQDISKRTGRNPGPKGGLLTWGIVGNYTSEDDFVKVLEPFWFDILGQRGEPSYFERILVFSEHEQSEQAYAHEIYLKEDNKELVVKKHRCPFTWMQM